MKFFRNQNERTAQDAVVGTAIGDRTTEKGVDGEMGGEMGGEKKLKGDGDVVVDDGVSEERPSLEAEAGVKKVEAVTLTWTKKELIFAYFW